MGLSENSVPLHPMVLLIIIPILNGYFIGGIPHFQTYPFGDHMNDQQLLSLPSFGGFQHSMGDLQDPTDGGTVTVPFFRPYELWGYSLT